MNTNETNEPKIIPVVCPDAFDRFQHKRALFRIEMNGKKHTRIGEFKVHANPLHIILQIVPPLDGEPNKYENIHLSQEAVDSIRPIQNEAEYEFVVTAKLNNCLFRKANQM